MNRDAMLLAAIVSMALVTYLTRASGVLLMRGVAAKPRVEKFIRHTSSSVLAAIVVAAALSAGIDSLVCIVSAAAAMLLSRNLFVAMVAGVAITAALRHFT